MKTKDDAVKPVKQALNEAKKILDEIQQKVNQAAEQIKQPVHTVSAEIQARLKQLDGVVAELEQKILSVIPPTDPIKKVAQELRDQLKKSGNSSRTSRTKSITPSSRLTLFSILLTKKSDNLKTFIRKFQDLIGEKIDQIIEVIKTVIGRARHRYEGH